jgi:hypothetical protein
MSEPTHKQVQSLLLKGAAPDDVMDILGITPTAYSNAVARITKLTVDAAYANEVLKIELARLDVLQGSYWDAAVQGGYDALKAVLEIMKRRAQYLGLDAPAQTNQSASSFVDVLASLSSHPAARIVSAPPEEPPSNGQLN